MMYLIIWINSAMVVIPEVYPEAQCESIVKDYNKIVYRNAMCIPAPKITITNNRPGGGLQDYEYKMKDLPKFCKGDCMNARP